MSEAVRARIGVLGAGYVGLVTAACFADLGRTVTLVDVNAARIAGLQDGIVPIHEPGLAEMLARCAASGRLRFSTDVRAAVAGSAAVFIAVGTPQLADGRADLQYVRAAALSIASALDGPTVIINKSTVPVQTGDLVGELVRTARPDRRDVVVVSNPEFLREGSGVADFMQPDRIVIGCDDPSVEALLRELYAPLRAPIIVVDIRTAEMVKYIANAFLATKISFVNEIAAICERVGVDIVAVVRGVAADKRIGPAFFNAGLGFGGSCLPKDVRALRHVAHDYALVPRLLDAVLAVNDGQVARVVMLLDTALDGLSGKTIAIWGLAFKPGTDDIRESPAIALVHALHARGARIQAHDPVAIDTARAALPVDITYAPTEDRYAAANGADALAIASEWDVYRRMDYERLRAVMTGRLLFDGRNALDRRTAQDAGFLYLGVGRL